MDAFHADEIDVNGGRRIGDMKQVMDIETLKLPHHAL